MARGYVVAIKPSARRINETAGRWVGGHGSTRAFSDKPAARDWAAEIRDDGPVRIQNAAPNDPAPVDGYLVADPARKREKSGETRTQQTEMSDLGVYASEG